MYKNWRAICQITDKHFMWALALLDLDTDFGRMVAKRFPEYFSNEQQIGPIPLSALRMMARKSDDFIDGHCTDPDNLLLFCNVIPMDWPVISFGDQDSIEAYPERNFELMPDELEDATEVGKIYKWQDKNLVLVETTCVAGQESYFVPAELIIIDK